MKNVDIQRTLETLTSIKTKTLPIKLSLMLTRNLRILEEANTDIESERMSLLRQYAKKDENGEIIIDNNGNAKVEDIPAFVEKFNELMNTDIELTFNYISEDDLFKCDGDGYDTLTVDEVSTLAFMLQEPTL